METSEHIERLGDEAARLADALAAAAADGRLGDGIVTCPDWTVRDLAEHVGGLYRWSAHLVGEGVGAETWRHELPIAYPASDDEVVPWFRDGIAPTLATFAAAPPAQRVWVWGTDPHARFWPRRILHETVVHGADLAWSTGRDAVVDRDLAVDGIDEYLTNLPATARWGAPLDDLRGERATLLLRATDSGGTWRVRLGRRGWWWDRGDGPGDAALVGSAADLYLHLQGRTRSGVTVDGDPGVVERWRVAQTF